MSLVPSFIETLAPYVPGKPIEETEREYGITGACKLASNENPLGPSRRAVEAIEKLLPKLHLYPDGASFYLKERLAKKLGVTAAEVMLGNGSNELIELLIRTFVHDDEEVLTSDQTFVIYRISSQAVGRRFRAVPMKDRHYDLEALAAAVGPKTRMIFLANPDNPTGSHQGRDAIVKFLDAIGEKPLVVMDEAYFEYVVAPEYPDTIALQQKYPNVITLRTFSKIYGLAGVRLGYGVARPELVDFVNRTRAPFNVSAVAQAAGLGALEDDEHVVKSRELNRAGLEELYRELPKLGIDPQPSQGNFVLADCHRPAGPLYEPLLRQGVIVRPMGGYGFGTSLRISTGTSADHARLLAALAKVL